jgi:phage virion morphogenesis protein
MAVSFQIDGMDICKARFKGMQERCKNPSEVMKIVAIKGWRGVVDQNFRDEKDQSGTRWDPLQADRRGKRHKGTHKLLQDTGRLRMSTGFKNTTDEAVVFNDCKYAAAHNYGYPKRNLPARQFLYVSDATMLQIMKTMTNYLTDGTFTVT